MKTERILVRIKTWDSMAGEYGTTDSGTIIECNGYFTDEMENGMPKNRVIEVESGLNGSLFYKNWSITDDMIEEELDPNENPEYFI
jgi:hypothetical protein